jgi:transposase
MLTLSATTRIYVAAEPVDLRKGFDTLAAATRHVLREDPLSGHLFAFYNRRRNRLKILVWQPSGFLILYKRLEHGTFVLPKTARLGQRHIEMEMADLVLMLEGIDLRGAKRRKRWMPPKSACTARNEMI